MTAFIRPLLLTGACWFQVFGLISYTLASHLPDSVFLTAHNRDIFKLAGQVAIGNGLGILVLGLLLTQIPRPRIATIALGAIFTGTILFAGSVDLIALRFIAQAPVAPIGGTLQILGWILASGAFIPQKSA